MLLGALLPLLPGMLFLGSSLHVSMLYPSGPPIRSHTGLSHWNPRETHQAGQG